MPFKSPINSPLTEVQSKAFSKVNSLRTYVSAPANLFPNLPEEQQISTFDFSLQLLNSVSGDGEGDKVFNKFMNKIFAITGPDSIVLEQMIVKGLADSLQARDIYLAPSGVADSSSSTTTSTSEGTSFSVQSDTTENTEDFRQFEFLEYKFFARREAVDLEKVVKFSYSTTIDSDIEIEVYANSFNTVTGEFTLESAEANVIDELPSFKRKFSITTDDSLEESNAYIEDLKQESYLGFFENEIQYPKEGDPIVTPDSANSTENNVPIEYNYFLENANEPEFGFNYRITNNRGLPEFINKYGGSQTPEEILIILKETAQLIGFYEEGTEYPSIDSTISAQNGGTAPNPSTTSNVPENLIITVKNNYSSSFPDFEITYLYADINGRTNEEIISELQEKANGFGFVNEGLEYPLTSTEISKISLPFGNLTGKIVDTSNLPIPGAFVEILATEPKLIIATDSEGNYTMKDLKSGIYNVKSSYSGNAFKEKQETFLVIGGKDNVLNFQLEDYNIVTVTASAASTESVEASTSNETENVNDLLSDGTISGPPSFVYTYSSDIINAGLGLEVETFVFPRVDGKTSEDYPYFPLYQSLESANGYRSIPEIISNYKTTAQQEGFKPDNGIIYPKTDAVSYTYTLVGEPIEYYFSRELNGNTTIPISTTQIENYENAIEANEDDGSLTLTLKVENNNPNLQTFEKIFTLIPEESIDYLSDLELDADNYEERLKKNGDEVVVDESTGLTNQYPAFNNQVVFNVDNNVDLPSFTASTSSNSNASNVEEAYNEVKNRHRFKFNIDGVDYPKEGSTITEQTITNPDGSETTSQIIGEIPNNESGTLDDVPVGVLEVPKQISFSSITSSIGSDLQNSFEALVGVSFNPDDVGLTNLQYLNKYLLPGLILGKRELVKQITTMLFGPKELMSEDPEMQEKLLNSAACGEAMFSVTNNPSETDKELEFNRVQLKEQLKKGKIELFISCQKVEVSLPENFIEQFDLASSEVTGVPESQRPNPAESFTLLSNFVQNEVQAQRNAQDANQVKKSFFQLLIDKILQYISVAFSTSPEIESVFSFINLELAKNGEPNISPAEFLSSPCDITNACKSGDKEEFKKKSAFSQSLIDSLYALVLSMILEKLLAELKIKIRKLIQEKAKEKIIKLRKRLLEKFKALDSLDKVSDVASKAAAFQASFNSSGIQGIFDLANQKE